MTITPVVAQIDKLSGNNQDNALEIVREAEKLYAKGQLTAAIDKWKQADYIYAVKADRLNRSMVLSNLALTYQKLENWRKSAEYIDESLKILNTLENTPEQQRILAETLDIQGQQQFIIGHAEQALEIWEKAAKIYRKIGEQESLFANLVNQAQAMQNLGLYPRSCLTLMTAFNVGAEKCNISLEKLIITPENLQFSQIKGLHILGNALRGVGNLEQSQKVLEKTQKIVQNLFPEYASNILLSLANTKRAICEQQGDKLCKAAQEDYQEAASRTFSKEVKLQAIINQIDFYPDISKIQEAEKLIGDLPLSQTRLYGEIKLAEYQFCQGQKKELKCLEPTEKDEAVDKWNQNLVTQISQKLIRIAEEAGKLGDKRTQSYTLAMVGRLYEKVGEWQKGREYTQQALEISQKLTGFNISLVDYEIQWQLGRLYFKLNQKQEAIKAYVNAVNYLKTLRNDLVNLNPDIQYDFREKVEPVYRKYVDVLLAGNPTQDNLKKAREVIESLQLAELENFFQEACATVNKVSVDTVDSNTAVIYPIILPDRLEVIVKLPGKENLEYSRSPVNQGNFEDEVKKLQGYLREPSSTLNEIKKPANQLYNWLIKPLETYLEKSKTYPDSQIKTLVFVLDGSLKNIPMSVLNDGQNFLIERYAIAVTPGLQLFDPQPLLRKNLNVLIAGASASPSFRAAQLDPLKNVPIELEEVRKQVALSQKLEDEKFLKEAIQKQINLIPFNVVHIATHGSFSSNRNQTYILDWEKPIKVQDINRLLQKGFENQDVPIELLVLSACETAAGDERAALGLAGVAIRAGARSTLASLWSVNDASTPKFMMEFYHELKNRTITKAEALRNVQKKWININKYNPNENSYYNNPYYWSAFILLGNWL